MLYRCTLEHTLILSNMQKDFVYFLGGPIISACRFLIERRGTFHYIEWTTWGIHDSSSFLTRSRVLQYRAKQTSGSLPEVNGLGYPRYTEQTGLQFFDRASATANGNWYYDSLPFSTGVYERKILFSLLFCKYCSKLQTVSKKKLCFGLK